MNSPFQYHTENEEVKYNDHAVRLHYSVWTVTDYIESQTDKEFTIKLGLENPYIMECLRLLFKMGVDGQNVYSMIWKQNDHYPTHGFEFVARGPEVQTTSGTTLRPMRFIKIHTSELILLANLVSPRSTNISSLRYCPVAQVEKDIARLSSAGEIVITIHQQEHGV
jgi:hypothetical protein